MRVFPLCRVIGVSVFLLSITVLFGWITGNSQIVQLHPAFAPMKFNTALCLLLLSSSLFLSENIEKRHRSSLWVARILSSASFLFSGVILLQYILKVDLGVDELFFKSALFRESPQPGRISPNGALALTLLAFSQIAFTYRQAAAALPTAVFPAAVTFAMATVSLLSYFVGPESFTGWGNWTRMALHTSVALLLVSFALIVQVLKVSRKLTRSAPGFLPLTATVVGVVLSLLVWLGLVAHEKDLIQEQVQVAAIRAREVIVKELGESRLLGLSRMAKRFAIRDHTPKNEWMDDATNYLKDQPGYQAIEWVDSDLVIRWVAPVKGNEKVVNKNLSREATRQVAFQRAYKTRSGVISSFVRLAQNNKPGFLIIVPIFNREIFKGYIVGVFLYEKMLPPLLSTESLSDFQVQVLEDGHHVIEQAVDLTRSDSSAVSEVALDVHGADWKIRVVPMPSLLKKTHSRAIDWMLLVGISISLMIAFVIYSTQRVLQLRKNEKILYSRLNDAIEGLHSAMALFDSEERLIICNKKYFDFFPNAEDAVRPGATYESILRAYIKNGGAIPQGYSADEWIQLRLIQHRNPERFSEVKLGDTYYQINDAPTNEGGVVRLATDITILKKLQEEIWHSSELQKAILNSANMGIISTDINGVIKSFNKGAERILGYTAEEVVNKLSPEPFHDREEVVARAKALSSELGRNVSPGFDVFTIKPNIGMTEENEWTYIRKDGSRFPVQLSVTKLSDSDGRTQGFLGIAVDISTKKKAREMLDLAREAAVSAAMAKTTFLANMSHEIRTPMNGIVGMSELLLETALSEEQQRFVKIIDGSANNLLRIINDILDDAKIEAGKLELEAVEFDPRELAENQMGLLSPVAREKNLDFRCEFASDLPQKLVGDPGRIAQILLNLLSNALKFTHAGRVLLRVHCTQQDSTAATIVFAVKDSGIGITSEVLKKLFQPYSQASASTARNFGGTGLGLSISKKLSEMMGGQINVESSEGQGSTFSVTLKLRLSSSHMGDSYRFVPLTVEKVLDGAEASAKSVLVVDDNAANQILALTFLRNLGYRAQAVSNGAEAVEAVRGNDYDLVLMDCQMPVMNGFEATKKIREGERGTNRRIPVIALTANAFEQDKDACAQSGMDDYLGKPFKKQQLAAVLAKWLSTNRSYEKNSAG